MMQWETIKTFMTIIDWFFTNSLQFVCNCLFLKTQFRYELAWSRNLHITSASTTLCIGQYLWHFAFSNDKSTREKILYSGKIMQKLIADPRFPKRNPYVKSRISAIRIYWRWDQIPTRSKHALLTDHTRHEPSFLTI
jgi:hypothetical protein